MNFKERKQLLHYYLGLSCAFSGMEKSMLFVAFDNLPEQGQTEVLQILREEITGLYQLFA